MAAAKESAAVGVRLTRRDADPENLGRLEALFDELDTNKDGVIDSSELIAGIKGKGYTHITEEQIKEFLAKSDANKSGDLNRQEFFEYLRQHERQLRLVFTSIDENKDGKLCTKEITAAFKKMGIAITEAEAEKLTNRINVDGNSLDISYEEWRDYLLFHPSSDLADIISSWRHNTRLLWDDGHTFEIVLRSTSPAGGLHGWGIPHECVDFGEDIGIPDDFSEQDIVTGMWWRHLVAGGIAGAVSRTCTAPLDRLKIWLQVHGGRKSVGMVDCVRYMIKEGGVLGLWRGNGMNVIKIAPESALKFGAYDHIKKMIRGDREGELQLHERFVAGSLAGGISQSLIYPMEVMKTRMALRNTNEYTGILDCGRKLYGSEGLKVFYRGYVPNLLGILPYAGIDLAVYETLKRKYLTEYAQAGDSSLPIFTLLACGTFSSCCGQVAAYPLALVRTKLQGQAGKNLNLPAEQTHMLGLFRHIWRTEGFTGLYRGIVPNFCKVAPAVSISYYIYERTRERLGVQMT